MLTLTLFLSSTESAKSIKFMLEDGLLLLSLADVLSDFLKCELVVAGKGGGCFFCRLGNNGGG